MDEWAPVMLDLERRKFELDKTDAVRPSIMAPGGVGQKMPLEDIVPYFGDLCQCMNDAYESRDKTIDCEKFIDGFSAIEAGLDRWRNYPAGAIIESSNSVKDTIL